MQGTFRFGLLACLLAGNLFAQAVAGLGGMSGVVRDATGAVVPGATVVVSNQSKGIRRTLETNNGGVFTAPALVPDSNYKVTVTKSGFATFEAVEVPIQVGQSLDLQVVLNVASSATQVEVTAAAAIVEDTKTDVSQIVNSKQIVELPINGRRV